MIVRKRPLSNYYGRNGRANCQWLIVNSQLLIGRVGILSFGEWELWCGGNGRCPTAMGETAVWFVNCVGFWDGKCDCLETAGLIVNGVRGSSRFSSILARH